MRKLTFLLAVLTATTTACIATGDDIEVDQPTAAHLAPVSQAVDAYLTDAGRLQIRVSAVSGGRSSVEGVVLDRGGRVIGELSPGGAVGQLAVDVAPELQPIGRQPVASVGSVTEIAPELKPIGRQPVASLGAAMDVPAEMKPHGLKPVEQIDLIGEIDPSTLSVGSGVESIDLVVETYTAEGVVTRSPITIDLSSLELAR